MLRVVIFRTFRKISKIVFSCKECKAQVNIMFLNDKRQNAVINLNLLKFHGEFLVPERGLGTFSCSPHFVRVTAREIA